MLQQIEQDDGSQTMASQRDVSDKRWISLTIQIVFAIYRVSHGINDLLLMTVVRTAHCVLYTKLGYLTKHRTCVEQNVEQSVVGKGSKLRNRFERDRAKFLVNT